MDDNAQKPEPDRRCLFDIAAGQSGYFTAKQARSCGYSRPLISHHAKAGRFARIRHGLYRLAEYPSSRREEIIAAWLSVGGESAVISHQSALNMLGISNVIPDSIHLTVPRSQRWKKRYQGIKIHTSVRPPQAGEIVVREGIPVTSPSRTIVDSAVAGVDPEQIRLAISTALARGMVTPQRLMKQSKGSGPRVEAMIRRYIAEAEQA